MTRVACLMGGWSAEREVSLDTGKACADALEKLGYEVDRIDVPRDVSELVRRLTPAPDAVFNALHGRWGEDGCVQGLLELMGVPYTHSGVRASALAMDKNAARQIFIAGGMRVAEGCLSPIEEAHHVMAPPYVIKPVHEGSSVGVTIVREGDNHPPLQRDRWAFGQEVLVERFIDGRELTVAVMDDRPLGVLEIRPISQFYNYDSKYIPGMSEHLLPAPIPDVVAEEAQRIAVLAHRALGCCGVTRADFRYDDTQSDPGLIYLLEVNTQPGMTATSLVPEMAVHAGIDFAELVRWIVENASCES